MSREDDAELSTITTRFHSIEACVKEAYRLGLARGRMLSAATHGIQIKGWWCHARRENGTLCSSFNGEEKDVYKTCKNCDAPKPI